MSEKNQKVSLGKKPIWFMFVAANFVVVLGCAITWILFAKSENTGLFWIPTLVCNMVGLILCGFFVWMELKEITPKIMHFQKKWFKYYIAAFVIFIVAIIFNALWFTLYLTTIKDLPITIEIESCWPLLVHLLVPIVLTLTAIGLQRYARFKIDLDIYKRQRGTILPENQPKKEQPKDEKPKDDQKASSGIVDQIDKK